MKVLRQLENQTFNTDNKYIFHVIEVEVKRNKVDI